MQSSLILQSGTVILYSSPVEIRHDMLSFLCDITASQWLSYVHNSNTDVFEAVKPTIAGTTPGIIAINWSRDMHLVAALLASVVPISRAKDKKSNFIQISSNYYHTWRIIIILYLAEAAKLPRVFSPWEVHLIVCRHKFTMFHENSRNCGLRDVVLTGHFGCRFAIFSDLFTNIVICFNR